MSRFALLCAVVMLGGFAAGRVLLRPRTADAAEPVPAAVAPAAAPATTDTMTTDTVPDTALYLRPGDPTPATRTRDTLSLTVAPAPGQDAGALEGAWQVRLAVEGAAPVTHTLTAYAVTGTQLVQLDADPAYEALVLTYTGGAHCCTTYHAFDADGGIWHRTSVDAGSFAFDVRDLDGDGAAELVSEDSRFEYAFGSFAGSRGPSRIVVLAQGVLREATRSPRFRAALVAHRDRLRAALPATAGDPDAQRGLLGALVAQHALLGDAPAGYALAARTYDGDDPAGFLHDLRAFLVEHGFLSRAEADALGAG